MEGARGGEDDDMLGYVRDGMGKMLKVKLKL